MDCLASRGIQKIDNSKYIFTRDLKQRILSLYGYSTDVIMEFAERVKCPHLIIKATRYPERWKIEEDPVDIIRKVYEKSNPSHFYVEVVEGNHALHLTHPENVWLSINPFLLKYKHKL